MYKDKFNGIEKDKRYINYYNDCKRKGTPIPNGPVPGGKGPAKKGPSLKGPNPGKPKEKPKGPTGPPRRPTKKPDNKPPPGGKGEVTRATNLMRARKC